MVLNGNSIIHILVYLINYLELIAALVIICLWRLLHNIEEEEENVLILIEVYKFDLWNKLVIWWNKLTDKGWLN